MEGLHLQRHDKKRYFVSVNHGLIQDVRNDSGEYEVLLTPGELTGLEDILKDLAKEDEYAFRRAFVPYKSADHDEAIDQFDDQTIRLFQYLHRYGSEETRQTIEQLNVLPKLSNTGYEDKGYDGGSPTNK
ncbi:hypothetical protein AML91_20640 [Paenibacillus jilunlii]|uniref:Uncharacterized protein n=1 Tax=Paenibacillus jilunlii TaxID=682956 RepID=A0ABR5SR93_9BACL|nr:hypothetical protein AML91_20640 [Paenibacillus jilunlii]